MKNIFFLLLLFPLFTIAQKNINTAKPWAYWWWMGSAVDEKGITRNLENYASAGLGGLHIIPIYGVKGEEARFIPYLSEKWISMLDYTLKEAQRLGLGIDMSLGTGWPYGGSRVTEADAVKAFWLKETGGTYTLEVNLTKQKVKRAAPGAEGWVVDHLSTPSVQRYLQPFDSLFTAQNRGVRAFYNDSYEVYGANWTTDFLEKFKILRGYDLSDNLDVLARDTAVTEREKRIWSDYHETISDLLLQNFTRPLMDFGHKHQKIVRNEAHGSPANILDLYGLSDVPESEFFGSKPFNIPLYRQDADYEISRFGVPGAVILKLASSPAHILGKKLVSSETATWLGNHFKVSLAQVKPIIDESFVGGINHVFYHGVPYSPPDAPFPGWLFYASTNFNQQSHFWQVLPQLNAYIERCQTRLQNSTPDNDILLYFPIYDLWHTAGKNAKTHSLDVHSIIRNGIFKGALGNTIQLLQNGGFSFDFVSDKQLQKMAAIAANLKSSVPHLTIEGSNGGIYKVILIPKCDYMPLATLQAIETFKKAGIKVVFVDKMPDFVNGYFDNQNRQAMFDKILYNFTASEHVSKGNLESFLKAKNIRFEPLAEKGLSFIRKKTDSSTLYFIVNHNQIFHKGTIHLSSAAESARVFDPLHQTAYFMDFKKIGNNQIALPLDLPSGESVFIELFNKKISRLKRGKTPSLRFSGQALSMPLKGKWQIDFISGQPALPKSFTTDSLHSWTVLSTDTMAQYFSGTGRYTLTFDVSKKFIGKNGWLELGDVRETAGVTLNGQKIGTAWSLPFRVPIPKGVLKPKNNVVQVEVTNLSANRIRYMDKKGVIWRKFYDINMVDINYLPFDASRWQPVPSGLLSEVRLVVEH